MEHRILLPLPEPISFSDRGSFAERTLLVRLPDLALRVLDENQLPESNCTTIRQLASEMPDGILLPIDETGAPDSALWANYLKTFAQKSWRDLPFIIGEHYFYRRVIMATGYYQPGVTCGVDPYLQQKQMGLNTSREAVQRLAERRSTWLGASDVKTVLREVLLMNLWSNRADLSLWPAGDESTPSVGDLHQAEEFLLANELEQVVAWLTEPGLQGERVDIMVDNAGYELVCDLALADLLLNRKLASEVRLHLKAHPTFVSDAMGKDVKATAALLAKQACGPVNLFGTQLLNWLETGRITLRESFAWNSPLAGWDLPEAILDELGEAKIVISKGDANYRRLLGDRHWLETTPFEKITRYFPTHLAAFRTAKCELMVGLCPGQAAELDQREPDWRFNGRWGMIQTN